MLGNATFACANTVTVYSSRFYNSDSNCTILEETMVTMVMCSVEIVDSCFYVGSLVVTHCIYCKPVQLLSVKESRKKTHLHCPLQLFIFNRVVQGLRKEREREKERESVTLTPKL